MKNNPTFYDPNGRTALEWYEQVPHPYSDVLRENIHNKDEVTQLIHHLQGALEEYSSK